MNFLFIFPLIPFSGIHFNLDSLSLLFPPFIESFFIGGRVFNSSNIVVGFNSSVHAGQTVTVELDLRSDAPLERTVRWFVDDQPQPVVVSHVPPSVRIAVCLLNFFFIGSILSNSLFT